MKASVIINILVPHISGPVLRSEACGWCSNNCRVIISAPDAGMSCCRYRK